MNRIMDARQLKRRLTAAVLRRIDAAGQPADAGTTLMELVVGMAIMSVFLGMFTGAIVLMTSTANKVEATTISSTQTTQALLTIDKSLRYASAISTPGLSTGLKEWYVEYDTTNTGTETCSQLRVDTTSQQLQRRTWTVSAGTAASPSNWVPLDSNVTNGGVAVGSADVPFSVPTGAVSAASQFQQLTVTLIATSGNTSQSTNRVQMTFPALNSTAQTSSNAAVCQQWGRP